MGILERIFLNSAQIEVGLRLKKYGTIKPKATTQWKVTSNFYIFIWGVMGFFFVIDFFEEIVSHRLDIQGKKYKNENRVIAVYV